ncbi:CGNR zinc finger domain-containing protein [Tsukamurella sp. 1534]|uniref:CGNR zinc finger domain-containing protein n=1 Tax=Tsukamurella sp. 1534 TaxID=1151061 RepID=UPI0002F2BE5C|nr:CGNR zinc finger domain-containing protein [Tsukamurella sp. 1534]
MQFAHDTEPSLLMAADLANSDYDGDERIGTLAALKDYLKAHEFTGWSSAEAADLEPVHGLRADLARVWAAPNPAAVAGIVNEMLEASPQQPRLTRHGKWDWHLHFTPDDAPIPVRMRAEFAMALVDLVRSDNVDRLKVCAADDCERVLVDLSRNRSRRFCAEGNCGNRTHVAAYRERRATGSADAPRPSRTRRLP